MTSEKNLEPNSQNPEDAVKELKELKDKLFGMDEYIKRRFSELSMEINATSQQLDMAEEGLGKRFGEVLETLGAISYHGTGSTAANTGIELDAVIETTEKAANTIIDAAEKIGGILDDKDRDWSKEEDRDEALSNVGTLLQDILLACSFQDLTGQRIRKALDSIKEIEDDLVATFEQMGVHYDVQEHVQKEVQEAQHSSQDDIDALFSE